MNDLRPWVESLPEWGQIIAAAVYFAAMAIVIFVPICVVLAIITPSDAQAARRAGIREDLKEADLRHEASVYADEIAKRWNR